MMEALFGINDDHNHNHSGPGPTTDLDPTTSWALVAFNIQFVRACIEIVIKVSQRGETTTSTGTGTSTSTNETQSRTRRRAVVPSSGDSSLTEPLLRDGAFGDDGNGNGEDNVTVLSMELVGRRCSKIVEFDAALMFVVLVIVSVLSRHSQALRASSALGASSLGLELIFVILHKIGSPHHNKDGDGKFPSIARRLLEFGTKLSLFISAVNLLWASATESTETYAADAPPFGVALFVVVTTIHLTLALFPFQSSSSTTATEALEDDVDIVEGNDPPKPTVQWRTLGILLRPYVWPDATPVPSSTSSSSKTESAERTPVSTEPTTAPSPVNNVWRNRIYVVLTWTAVAVSKACNLVAPALLGSASTALSQQKYTKATQLAILNVVLVFLSKTFKEVQSLAYLRVSQAAFVQLATASFRHVHNLDMDWHLKKKLGEVVRSMDRGISACDTLMKYLFLWLIPAILECIVTFIIFAKYFHYWPISVSTFYFVSLYMLATVVMTLWRKKYRKAVARSDNKWHDMCTDSLLNFETVKYFGTEEHEVKHFSQSIAEFSSGSVNVQASLSALNITQQFLQHACTATALALAIRGIMERNDCCANSSPSASSSFSMFLRIDDQCSCPGMQVGDFVAVYAYVANLFAPLNFLGSVYNAIIMALVDLTNLAELLAERPSVKDAVDAVDLMEVIRNSRDNDDDELYDHDRVGRDDVGLLHGSELDGMNKFKYSSPFRETPTSRVPAVKFEGVHFHYPSQPAESGLHGLSFTMERGTVTAIVGSTGAGKTTVSRLLFRFYDVHRGSVSVFGRDVRDVTQASLRKVVGAVPQQAGLFHDTLRANIAYGDVTADVADGSELERVASDAQLTGFLNRMPEGWDTIVGDRGLKLSGGEMQRVAIARCLLKDPPIVVLDEATSALDTVTERSVQRALDRLGEDRTVLVIAHRLGTIRDADNIIVLDGGVVAEQGTHDELLQLGGRYAKMWNMQLSSSAITRENGNLDVEDEDEGNGDESDPDTVVIAPPMQAFANTVEAATDDGDAPANKDVEDIGSSNQPPVTGSIKAASLNDGAESNADATADTTESEKETSV